MYFQNDVPVFVNRLNSEEAIIPYEYHQYVEFKFYNFQLFYKHFLCTSFDFCTDDHETGPVENLGQVVFGERIRSSPYKVW